jgi:hypothetical protein
MIAITTNSSTSVKAERGARHGESSTGSSPRRVFDKERRAAEPQVDAAGLVDGASSVSATADRRHALALEVRIASFPEKDFRNRSLLSIARMTPPNCLAPD